MSMDIADYITPEEAAERLGFSAKYIQKLCRDGRIEGAIKRGGIWLIPADANFPMRTGGDPTLKFGKSKRKVFEAAAKLFAERSFDTISVKDITDAIGITQSAFYNHFSSKQEILDAVYLFFEIRYKADRPTRPVIEAILRSGTLEEILCCTYYNFHEDYREVTLACAKIIMQRTFIDTEARRLFDMVFGNNNIDFVTEVFDHAVEMGRLAPFDTRTLASHCVTQRCYHFINYLIDDSPEASRLRSHYQHTMNEWMLSHVQDLGSIAD